MSKISNPKIWYLVGIGAVALAIDGLRRWVKRQQLEAESTPAVHQAPDAYIPLVKATTPAEPPTAPATGAGRAAATTASTARDDLTAIKGIGPTYAKRLAAAGITTFSGLAAASPDRLREVAKTTAMVDPQDWIDQAAARSTGDDSAS